MACKERKSGSGAALCRPVRGAFQEGDVCGGLHRDVAARPWATSGVVARHHATEATGTAVPQRVVRCLQSCLRDKQEKMLYGHQRNRSGRDPVERVVWRALTQLKVHTHSGPQTAPATTISRPLRPPTSVREATARACVRVRCGQGDPLTPGRDDLQTRRGDAPARASHRRLRPVPL
ncbi:hypothetical protein MRX96_055832 [Rhipicephalus microplus]